MLPFYSNLTDELTQKLHKVVMTSARMAIGDYCYKVKCDKILARCNWLPIRYMINVSQCIYLHKIITNKSPQKIYDYLIIPNRQAKDIRLNYQSKTKLSKSSLLYHGLNIYNNLPIQIRQFPQKKFKLQVKKHFFSNSEHIVTLVTYSTVSKQAVPLHRNIVKSPKKK